MKRGASASTRHSSLSRTISVSPIPYRFSVRRETAKLHSDRGTCAGQAVTTTWWSWLSPCRNIVDATGQRAGYAPLLRLLCDAFGIRVDNIYVKKTFVLDRSDSASFLRKLLAAFDRTVEEHLK